MEQRHLITEKNLKHMKRTELLELAVRQEKELKMLRQQAGQTGGEFEDGALDHLDAKLKQKRYRKDFFRTLMGTVNTLVVAGALMVLLSALMVPVFQVYGSSMEPTLQDGDVVAAVRSSQFTPGDVAVFYYNNKILIKRVIALPGDVVAMDESGRITVNGEMLSEPYVAEYALGNCDVTFPLEVPQGRVFVLGDNRTVSVDSRSNIVGCISEEQLIGKLAVKIWPLKKLEIFQ